MKKKTPNNPQDQSDGIIHTRVAPPALEKKLENEAISCAVGRPDWTPTTAGRPAAAGRQVSSSFTSSSTSS